MPSINEFLSKCVRNYQNNLYLWSERPGLDLATRSRILHERSVLEHWNKLTKILLQYHEQIEKDKALRAKDLSAISVNDRRELGKINEQIHALTVQLSDCIQSMLGAFQIPFTDPTKDFYFWSTDSGENAAYKAADQNRSPNYVASASIPLFQLLLGPAEYYPADQSITFEEKEGSMSMVLRDMLYPDVQARNPDVPDLQMIFWSAISRLFANHAVSASAANPSTKARVYIPCQINQTSNFWCHELPILQAARSNGAIDIEAYQYDPGTQQWQTKTLDAYPIARNRPMFVDRVSPLSDQNQTKSEEKRDHEGKSYYLNRHSLSQQRLSDVAKRFIKSARDKERSKDMNTIMNILSGLTQYPARQNSYQAFCRIRHQQMEKVADILKEISGHQQAINFETRQRDIAKALQQHLYAGSPTRLTQEITSLNISAQLQLLQAFKKNFQYQAIFDLFEQTQQKRLIQQSQALAIYIWACNRYAGDHPTAPDRPQRLKTAEAYCIMALKKFPENKDFIFEQTRQFEVASSDAGKILKSYQDALMNHHVSSAGSKYMEYVAQHVDSNSSIGSRRPVLRPDSGQMTSTVPVSSYDPRHFNDVATRTYHTILVDGIDECNEPAILRSAFIAAYHMNDQEKIRRVIERMRRVDMRDNELGYLGSRYVLKQDKSGFVCVAGLPEYAEITSSQTEQSFKDIKLLDDQSIDPYTALMVRSYDYRQSLSDHVTAYRRNGNLQYGGALPQQIISKDDIDIFTAFVSEKKIADLLPSKETIERYKAQFGRQNPDLDAFLARILLKYYSPNPPDQRLADISDVNAVLSIITDIVALNYKLMGNAADLKIVPHRDLDFAMRAMCAVLGDKTVSKSPSFDSGTSLSIMYAMQVGDCRHHAETTQILFDIWKRNRMESLLDQPDQLLQLESTQLRLIDTKCDTPTQPGQLNYAHTFNILSTKVAGSSDPKFTVYDAFELSQDPCDVQLDVKQDPNNKSISIGFTTMNILGQRINCQLAPWAGDKGQRTQDVYGLTLQGFNGITQASVMDSIFDPNHKRQTQKDLESIVQNEKIAFFKRSSLDELYKVLVEDQIPFVLDGHQEIPQAELGAIDKHLQTKLPQGNSKLSAEMLDRFTQVLYQYRHEEIEKLMAPAAVKQQSACIASFKLKVYGACFGAGLGALVLGVLLLPPLGVIPIGIAAIGYAIGSTLIGGGLLSMGFFAARLCNEHHRKGNAPASALAV